MQLAEQGRPKTGETQQPDRTDINPGSGSAGGGNRKHLRGSQGLKPAVIKEQEAKLTGINMGGKKQKIKQEVKLTKEHKKKQITKIKLTGAQHMKIRPMLN